MSRLIDSIDKTAVLVLDKRYDMWLDLKEECEAVGIHPEPFFAGDGSRKDIEYDHIDTKEVGPDIVGLHYPAWKDRPNAWNCCQCHFKIMNKYLDEGVDNLLLLEDDAQIFDDFLEILEECEEFFFLEKLKWDMIYFGCAVGPKGKWVAPPWNSHIYRVSKDGGGGWGGVLMKRKIMEHFVNVPKTRGILAPFDWLCQNNYVDIGLFNRYSISPMIISQKPGFSQVDNVPFNGLCRDVQIKRSGRFE